LQGLKIIITSKQAYLITTAIFAAIYLKHPVQKKEKNASQEKCNLSVTN